MKRFWIFSSFAAAMTLAGSLLVVSCGPKDAFCPNTGDGGVCPVQGDEKSAPVVDSGGGSLDACNLTLFTCSDGTQHCGPCP